MIAPVGRRSASKGVADRWREGRRPPFRLEEG